jgi:glutamine synthetase
VSPPAARRVENRLAGADANPYLVLAASLLCGYMGMVGDFKPSAPVKGRAYERRNLRLPITIEHALERMEACKDAEKFLGEKFMRGYVAVKRAEHENYKRVISSWEREFLLLSV